MDRNAVALMIRVLVMVMGAEYTNPLVNIGTLPFVVYRISFRPEPPVSVADRLTVTPVAYAAAHGDPLQLIALDGAEVSTRINGALTASALPALSKARYLTVVVEGSENGAVYTVPFVAVGSEPSVV